MIYIFSAVRFLVVSLLMIMTLTQTQFAMARFRAPQVDCNSHQAAINGLRDGMADIYNVHLYRDPEGNDTQQIIDRTGKYSALGYARVRTSNGNFYNSSATLFHNCLVVVSRHAFEVDPVVGKTTVPLFFGTPKGENAFSYEVTGSVVEVLSEVEVNYKKRDIKSIASDLVVVEIKDKDQCASLSSLTPAVPVPITADVFIQFNSGNSGDFEFLSTRTPKEEDSKDLRNSKDIQTRRKSIKDTCGVSSLYTEQSPDVVGGAVIYHNCSSTPGSSGGAIAVKTTDPMLYVGAIHSGAPPIDGKGVATFKRFGDMRDFEVDNQNANTAAFIGALSPEILRRMAGE